MMVKVITTNTNNDRINKYRTVLSLPEIRLAEYIRHNYFIGATV